jgi:hypothetical protein
MAARALRSARSSSARSAVRDTAIRSMATLPTSNVLKSNSVGREQIFQPSAQLKRSLSTNLGAKNM